MINVNQITAQLARMPDQALQQYASMHKNDPYTVSLALAESNRRKDMRTAAQGQQGGEQPKVVDQGIAGMMAPAPQPQMVQAQEQGMPEDSGIAQLPADNLKGMAGGGIVAFSGADESLVTDPQFGGATPEAFLPVPSAARNQAEVAAIVQALRARGETVGLPQILAIQEGRLSAPAGARTAVTPPVVAPSAAPVVSPVAAPAPAPGASGPRAPATPEIGFAERFKAAMGTAPDFEAKRAASLATEKAGEETGLAKLKTDQESEIASMFKGREERVGKREGELEKSKESNKGMAFLEAGLAMMQSRGRGLAGIAEGAAVGTKQYASGIKDIRAAQEKLDDARDRMEELRQNQSSMNKRDVRIAEKGIRDIVNRGNEKQLDAAEKLYGIKREDAKTALVSDLTRAESALDRQSREKIANMPPAQMQLISKLGGGDFQKGYEIYKQEAGIPRLYESYTKMASDPLKGADFQAKFPTFETYMAGSGMLGGKQAGIIDLPNAAAGTVRPR